MRGCSDFFWDMGRSVLVRNRCHLAGLLEQRAHHISWTAAVARVAQRLVLAANLSAWAPEWCHSTGKGPSDNVRGPLEAIIGGSVEWPPPADRRPSVNASVLASALDLCAHGVFATDPVVRRVQRQLWNLNTLDYLSASVIAYDLRGTLAELDTIQISNRCSEESNDTAHEECRQAVEIWDVRTIQTNFTSLATTGAKLRFIAGIPRPWSSPNGSLCNLTKDAVTCLACEGSLSEEACQYKCSTRRRGKPSHIAPEEATRVTYGQGATSAGHIQNVKRMGALGSSLTWQHLAWGRVVDKLPRLPSPPRSRVRDTGSDRGPRIWGTERGVGRDK
jgi:hypothetical protein